MADPRLPARVRRLFRLESRSADATRADADAELASFLEARVDDLVAHGMPREAARASTRSAAMALLRRARPRGRVLG